MFRLKPLTEVVTRDAVTLGTTGESKVENCSIVLDNKVLLKRVGMNPIIISVVSLSYRPWVMTGT